MIRSRIYELAVVLAACSDAPLVPDHSDASPQTTVTDQDLAGTLATTAAERHTP
jgi:hypothetical protein